MKGLQNLSDRRAVVVRGRARQTLTGAARALRENFSDGLLRALIAARRFAALRFALGSCRRRHLWGFIADVQRVFYRRQRCLGRVLGFLVLHDLPPVRTRYRDRQHAARAGNY
ncbi:MAG: hypothetical protein IPK23_05740 [Rhizobiales bacterium]|nr:hypothetical protein [Hyphomicrobiales bacterium]